MAIDNKLVVQLRQQTGAGILECRAALEAAGGDITKAIEELRKKGAIKAAKKSAERETKEGIIYSYTHSNSRVGTIFELSCETDFVARNKDFQELAHDLAMQIVAMSPLFVKPKDVPAELLEKEKEIYREQLKKEGKPEEMIEKILVGKLNKYYEEVCLLKQHFIKDEDITIEELINQKIAVIGEKIEIKRFARFEI